MAVKRADVGKVGRKMYAAMREEMEANEWGRVVVIDVNSGDYEVADDDLTATLQLIERRPDAITWGEWVGHRAMYFLNRNEWPGGWPIMEPGQGND